MNRAFIEYTQTRYTPTNKLGSNNRHVSSPCAILIREQISPLPGNRHVLMTETLGRSNANDEPNSTTTDSIRRPIMRQPIQYERPTNHTITKRYERFIDQEQGIASVQALSSHSITLTCLPPTINNPPGHERRPPLNLFIGLLFAN